MNDEQITALAREYAEWMIKDAQCEELPNCLKKTILASNTEYAEEVFRWLLRRFFLVEKSKVQELYNSYCAERDKEEPGSNRLSLGGRIAMLQELFGSKCLPDEVAVAENATTTEPKPSEPKFKVGSTVRIVKDLHHDNKYKGEVTEIVHVDDDPFCPYKVDIYDEDYGGGLWYSESDLEPYTEPEDLDKRSSTCTDDCPSPGKEASQLKPIASKVSVYLATKEEDEAFRQLLHENGFKWNSTALLTNLSLWDYYNESAKIHFAHPNKTVTFEGDRTSDTLTFSEFKKRYFEEETSPNVNHSDINIDELVATGCVPDPAKQFDNILKDSFSKERRLNIATQMVKAIMQCPEIVERIASAEADSLLDDILHEALYLTDRLMSECEKGGLDGN